MPDHDPSISKQAAFAPSAGFATHFGSFRAGSLVLLTFVIPAVALVGPNEIYDWLSPAHVVAEQPTAVAKSEASASYAMHYGNEGQLAVAAAAPELSVQKGSAAPALTTREHDQAEPVSQVQMATHDIPAHRESGPELLFREPVGGSQDRMQQIQQRLQLLGAQYMVLEAWGDVSPKYRFYCQMPDRPGAETEYEFTSHDPLEAMQRVLGQVESRMARR